jgi:uncharacterized protein
VETVRDQTLRWRSPHNLLCRRNIVHAPGVRKLLAGLPAKVRAAYSKENWPVVIEQTLPAAEKGNPYAQTIMGLLSYHGYGVPQNYLEAARWYGLAAKQQFAIAQANLADLYIAGYGVGRDVGRAIDLWERAADKGHTIAMADLGSLYAMGEGVSADICKAYDWWRKAAVLGGGLGQDQLSVVFARGDGVPRDYLQAYIWSLLAIQNLEVNHLGQRLEAERRSKRLASELTPEQISKAHELMREKSPKDLGRDLPTCSR